MKRCWFFCAALIVIMSFLFGCVPHRAGSPIRPSAVPEKVLTKTAMPSSEIRPDEEVSADESSPWKYCRSVFNDSGMIYRVADLESKEFMRRVQITFMIQDGERDTSFIVQRCMNGALYVCEVSEETNCLEKLDFSTEANEEMLAFCRDPEMDGVAVNSRISGRNSAYEWRCRDGAPVITAQIAKADAAGYDQSLWVSIPVP